MFGILKFGFSPGSGQRLVSELIYAKYEVNGVPAKEMEVRQSIFRRCVKELTSQSPMLRPYKGDKQQVLEKVRKLDEKKWCLLFDKDGIELGIQLYVYSLTMDISERNKRAHLIASQINDSCFSTKFKMLMLTYFGAFGFVYPTAFLKSSVRSEVGRILRLSAYHKQIPDVLENYMHTVYDPEWRKKADLEIGDRIEFVSQWLKDAFPQNGRIVPTKLSSQELKEIAMVCALWSSEEVTKKAIEEKLGKIKSNCFQEYKRSGKGRSRKSVLLDQKFNKIEKFLAEVRKNLSEADKQREFRILFRNLPDLLACSSNPQEMTPIWHRSTEEVDAEDAKEREGNLANICKFLDTGFFSGAMVESNHQILQHLHKKRLEGISAIYERLKILQSNRNLSISDLKEMLFDTEKPLEQKDKAARQQAQEAADTAMQSLMQEIEQKKWRPSRQKRGGKTDSKADKKRILEKERSFKTDTQTSPLAPEIKQSDTELIHQLKLVGLRQGLEFRLDELNTVAARLKTMKETSKTQSRSSVVLSLDEKNLPDKLEACCKKISEHIILITSKTIPDDFLTMAGSVIQDADEIESKARILLRRQKKRHKSVQNFHNALMKLLEKEDLIAGRTDGGRISLHGLTFDEIEAFYHGYRFWPRKPVKIGNETRLLKESEALALYVTFSSRTNGVQFCISVGLWTLRMPGDPLINMSDRNYQISEENREQKIDPALWRYTGQRMAVLHVGAAKNI